MICLSLYTVSKQSGIECVFLVPSPATFPYIIVDCSCVIIQFEINRTIVAGYGDEGSTEGIVKSSLRDYEIG